jgi:hypothetical protein
MNAQRGLGPRAGALNAAVWLIGLGTVFLVQQLTEWPWAKAWPMFVILLGVGGLASLLLDGRPAARRLPELGWPLIVIAAGVLFLLSTTGALGIGVGEMVTRWWPLALIVLGAWFLLTALWSRGTGAGDGQLSVPLGGAGDAEVRIKFGGGELEVGPAPAGTLLVGSFDNAPARSRSAGPGRIEIEPESFSSWPWLDRVPRWQLGVAADVPLDLRLEVGAARTRVNLADTRLRRLRISTGASDTRITLPRAAGETLVRTESGAAAITLEVPAGVAARVRSRMALGSTSVDPRFPRVGNGWESPDWAGATNRVEIEIEGGVGSVRVVSA